MLTMQTRLNEFLCGRVQLRRRIIVIAVLTIGWTPAVIGSEPSFSRQSIDNRVAIGYGIVIGEVNGDDRADILLADKTEIVWYQNPGTRNERWQRHVMARNLTPRDNVCLAARDLDGDGLVEVAVGANWNPGETSDPEKSGALFYLKRPADPTGAWTPVSLAPHDPTVHRMHWLKRQEDEFQLVVLPLHGRDNRGGEGQPVRVMAYQIPVDQPDTTKTEALDESMHMAHNFDVIIGEDGEESLLIAGREGLKWVGEERAILFAPQPLSRGAGEVRWLNVMDGRHEAVAIEPMHGTEVVMYQHTGNDREFRRIVIDSGLNQGHALATGDLIRLGRDQVVAGWRSPDASNKVGVRLYVPDEAGQTWTSHWIDDNQMACEDLRLADLDGDDRLDIIAAGRATNNLVVYWNDNE